jgi:small subunit ribosomal protein S11
VPKKKISSGILFIQSTYNNTLLNLTDEKGNAIMGASSGTVGFKGTKKSTPFAASKAADILADKAKMIGINNVGVVVKGVGAGRESAIRTFAAKGIEINFIRDVTPVPHNGPKPPKPRRV